MVRSLLLAVVAVTCQQPGPAPATRPATPMTLDKQRELPAYAGAIAVSPDGHTWVTDEQEVIGVWTDDQRVREIAAWPQGALSIGRDGKQVRTAAALLDLASGTEVFAVPKLSYGGEGSGAGWSTQAAAWSPDDRQVLLWERYRPTGLPQGEGGPSYEGPSSKVVVVDARTGKSETLLSDDEEHQALAVSDRYLVAAGVADAMVVWSRSSRSRVKRVALDEPIYAAQFTPDGKRLIVVAAGHRLAVYDSGSWQRLAEWDVLPDGAFVTAMAVHPTLPLLAAGGDDKKVHLYSLTHLGRELGGVDLAESPQALAFTAAGDELLVSVITQPSNLIQRYALKGHE